MKHDKLETIRAFKEEDKNRLLGRLLNRSYRYLSEIATDFLKGKGFVDFRIGHIIGLVHIDLDGSTVNQMASTAGITKQGMSKVVKELSDNGYAFTEKHPSDARSIVVKLTDKGIDALMEWKLCTEHIDEKFTKILGSEQLEGLKNILGVLVEHFESNPEHDSENQILSSIMFDKE
ncbi:MAG: MarR family winged helix-turn-helix transcriptional regulator [Arcicella sp.]|nr:MarR family winged helix-turn-helix transcriptional regulator [Arcicella sp.]